MHNTTPAKRTLENCKEYSRRSLWQTSPNRKEVNGDSLWLEGQIGLLPAPTAATCKKMKLEGEYFFSRTVSGFE